MSKESQRDDFSEITKKLLRDKVSGLCSKPDCHILTRGPNSKANKVTSIGQAAHITAAAKGGPRYDELLTKEQRKSHENGIWLCNNHARLIDADENKFSSELLRRWKSDTENFVEGNIGKSLISREEADVLANSQMANLFIGNDFNSLSSSAEKVVGHIDSLISSIDPRFSVRTDIVKGKVKRYISAIENDVLVTLKVGAEHPKEFAKKFYNFQNLGEDFEFSAEKIDAEGSDLFKKMFDTAPKGSKIFLRAPESFMDGELYVSDGENSISLGGFKAKFKRQKGLNVMTAKAVKEFVVMRNIHGHPSGQMTCSLLFDFSKWEGIDVNKIPFFPKLRKIMPLIVRGGNFVQEIDGGESGLLISGDTKTLKSRSQLNNLVLILTHLDYARIIAKALDISLTFKLFSSNKEELHELSELSSMFIEPIELIGDQINEHSYITIVNSDRESFAQTEKLLHSAKCFKIQEPCKIESLYKQEIKIPDITHEVFDAELRVKSTDILENGDHVTKVALITNQNTRYRKSITGFD